MSRGGAVWFRRFADVPGVGYHGDVQRRSRLAERDLVPEVHEYDFDGRRSVSLMWTTRRGSSSASPVHELAFGGFADESSARVRERVLDALELPGEPMDYHFAMQGAAELLYKRRRSEPAFLPFVEWLAWFDARLVEAHEALFRIGDDSSEYLQIFALGFLIDFHEREGYLHEALALAERFARFRPRVDTTELRGRVEQAPFSSFENRAARSVQDGTTNQRIVDRPCSCVGCKRSNRDRRKLTNTYR